MLNPISLQSMTYLSLGGILFTTWAVTWSLAVLWGRGGGRQNKKNKRKDKRQPEKKLGLGLRSQPKVKKTVSWPDRKYASRLLYAK